jgi:hypothetical protein
MNKICNNREKTKETVLKASIYLDDMIWGGDVKELQTRQSHWERGSKDYGWQVNLEKTVMLKLLRNRGKHTAVKINAKEIKEIDKFVYLGSVVEKNGKIQNEIN